MMPHASCGNIVPDIGIGGCTFIRNVAEAGAPDRTPPYDVETATTCLR